MKWLAAGLGFVNASTVSALLLGVLAHGLNRPIAWIAFFVGLIVAAIAWRQTNDDVSVAATVQEEALDPDVPRRAKRGRASRNPVVPQVKYDYTRIWFWLLATCFAFLGLRSFCWLLYIDGGQLKVQSPNNLGDLGLHLTYIRTFANGVALWPDNPIYVFSKLRYPAGTDFFNSLLTIVGLDVSQGLVWTGLLASVATFYALYRWAGNFGVAAFLFNGGLAGFEFFKSWSFLDYQGDKTIAWKSIALSMFVPQRGMLYALPVGVLLLSQWRRRFGATDAESGERTPTAFLPFWLEVLLYATLPFFHAHTFLALSVVLGFFVVLGAPTARRHAATVLLYSVIPATVLSWLITDRFHAGSVLQWKPGWVQQAGDFSMPFVKFWLVNFGAWIPLALLTVWVCGRRAWNLTEEQARRFSPTIVFLASAIALFLLTYLVKTAPWEWDNIKVLVWAYFLVIPFIAVELRSLLPLAARVPVYLLLFGSGFVTLFGGLAAGRTGFALSERSELDGAGEALRKLPVEARFAAYPTYNHPVLLQGHKSVLGYPGHLWTQGFDYAPVEKKLTALMLGQPGWRDLAHELGARYLFWGREETTGYPKSARPWERESELVAAGTWGAIFDLEKPKRAVPLVPRQ